MIYYLCSILQRLDMEIPRNIRLGTQQFSWQISMFVDIQNRCSHYALLTKKKRILSVWKYKTKLPICFIKLMYLIVFLKMCI